LEVWTVKRILEWSVAYFAKKQIPNPKLSSEILLSEVMGFKRIDLYLNYSKVLSPAELSLYKDFVKKRSEHQPVQYIIGKAYFRKLELYVDSNVLIPRPETEVLVDKAMEKAKKILGQKDKLKILEIGTGSGAIAISLAKELEGKVEVIATEKYGPTLEIAKKNAKSNLDEKDLEKIKFYQADILPDDTSFIKEYSNKIDILISNPPYISEESFERLPREVKEFEPKNALLGGKEGIDFYAKILKASKEMLIQSNGYIILETDPIIYRLLQGLAKEILDGPQISISKDYTGKERVMSVKIG